MLTITPPIYEKCRKKRKVKSDGKSLFKHFHFSIAFDFLFRVSKQEIKSDGKVKSDFIDSWIKKQNLLTFPSLFGRHFSYMCDVKRRWQWPGVELSLCSAFFPFQETETEVVISKGLK